MPSVDAGFFIALMFPHAFISHTAIFRHVFQAYCRGRGKPSASATFFNAPSMMTRACAVA